MKKSIHAVMLGRNSNVFFKDNRRGIHQVNTQVIKEIRDAYITKTALAPDTFVETALVIPVSVSQRFKTTSLFRTINKALEDNYFTIKEDGVFNSIQAYAKKLKSDKPGSSQYLLIEGINESVVLAKAPYNGNGEEYILLKAFGEKQAKQAILDYIIDQAIKISEIGSVSESKRKSLKYTYRDIADDWLQEMRSENDNTSPVTIEINSDYVADDVSMPYSQYEKIILGDNVINDFVGNVAKLGVEASDIVEVFFIGEYFNGLSFNEDDAATLIADRFNDSNPIKIIKQPFSKIAQGGELLMKDVVINNIKNDRESDEFQVLHRLAIDGLELSKQSLENAVRDLNYIVDTRQVRQIVENLRNEYQQTVNLSELVDIQISEGRPLTASIRNSLMQQGRLGGYLNTQIQTTISGQQYTLFREVIRPLVKEAFRNNNTSDLNNNPQLQNYATNLEIKRHEAQRAINGLVGEINNQSQQLEQEIRRIFNNNNGSFSKSDKADIRREAEQIGMPSAQVEQIIKDVERARIPNRTQEIQKLNNQIKREVFIGKIQGKPDTEIINIIERKHSAKASHLQYENEFSKTIHDNLKSREVTHNVTTVEGIFSKLTEKDFDKDKKTGNLTIKKSKLKALKKELSQHDIHDESLIVTLANSQGTAKATKQNQTNNNSKSNKSQKNRKKIVWLQRLLIVAVLLLIGFFTINHFFFKEDEYKIIITSPENKSDWKVNTTIEFDIEGVGNNDNNSYIWNFGNGSPQQNTKQAEIKYDKADDYTVTVKIISPSGITTSVKPEIITIKEIGDSNSPIIEVKIDGDNKIITIKNPEEDANYKIIFDNGQKLDGEEEGGIIYFNIDTDTDLSNSKLEVERNGDVEIFDDIIDNPDTPKMEIETDIIGLHVDFRIEGNSDVTPYTWNFGDGGQSKNQEIKTIEHTYNKSGTYTVSVQNAETSTSRLITVKEEYKPKISTPKSQGNGKFFIKVLNPDSYKYKWEFDKEKLKTIRRGEDNITVQCLGNGEINIVAIALKNQVKVSTSERKKISCRTTKCGKMPIADFNNPKPLWNYIIQQKRQSDCWKKGIDEFATMLYNNRANINNCKIGGLDKKDLLNNKMSILVDLKASIEPNAELILD